MHKHIDSFNIRRYLKKKSLPSRSQPHTRKEFHVARTEWAPLKPRDRFEGRFDLISSYPYPYPYPSSKHASTSSCCLKAASQTSPPGRHTGQFNCLIKMALTVKWFMGFFLCCKGSFCTHGKCFERFQINSSWSHTGNVKWRQNITPVHLRKVSLCFNFLYALNPFHDQFSSVSSPFNILTAFHINCEILQDKLMGCSLLCSVTCCFVIQLSDNQTSMNCKHYILKTVCKKCQWQDTAGCNLITTEY